MAYVILNLVCVAALVGIDQAIKLWATQYLAPVEAITVIPHVWSCASCSIRAWRSAC